MGAYNFYSKIIKNLYKKYPAYFISFVITIVYALFNLSGHPVEVKMDELNNVSVSLIDHVAGFVGMFVSIGVHSLTMLILIYTAGSFLVYFYGLNLINKFVVGKNYSGIEKIFWIFALLFILTMLTDIFLGLPFESFRIFVDGYVSII